MRSGTFCWKELRLGAVGALVFVLLGCEWSMFDPSDTSGPLDVPYPDPVNGVMTLHVAPGGDDDAVGTASDPLASIQGALARTTVNWREADLKFQLEELRIRVARGRYTPGAGLVPENVGFAVRLAHQGTVFEQPKIVIEGGYGPGWERPDYATLSATGAMAAPEDTYSVLDGDGELLHIALIERGNVEMRGFVLTGAVADDEPLGVQAPPPAVFPDDTLWRGGAGLFVIARGALVEEVYIVGNDAIESRAVGALVVWAGGSSGSRGTYRLYTHNGDATNPAQTASVVSGSTYYEGSSPDARLELSVTAY